MSGPALLAAALAPEAGLAALTPEAGPRRYFRPTAPGMAGWLLVRGADPPPYASAAWLVAAGVRVPRLGPAGDGAYLVEDLGDRHLCDDPTVPHYRAVLAFVERLAPHRLRPSHPCRARALDVPLFQRELAMFEELWLRTRRRVERAGPAQLAAELAWLARAAAAAPWSVQHRDLHSRNVMLPQGGGVALIDHQDLRPGPFLYDLASLATDAYVDLPPAIELLLRAAARQHGAARGLSPGESERRFRLTALQRVLKALGTFARMLAAGREVYAAAEVRALRHARALLARSPETPRLAALLA